VADGLKVVWRLFNVMNIGATDGTGARSAVPHAVVNDYPSSAGPDADSLLVTRVTRQQSGDVYLFSLSGAYAPKPLVASPGYDGGATLSPGGRWMVYYSSSSGQGEASVTRFPDIGRQWQVSVGGGRQVRWSGDGREIYHRANGKFMAVAFDGTGAAPVIGRPAPLFSDVYDFGTAISLATYDVTKDGRFIVTKRKDGTSSLQVVSNWTTELERTVAAGGLR
jgi:WD40-like Beta Propeller Repeat